MCASHKQRNRVSYHREMAQSLETPRTYALLVSTETRSFTIENLRTVVEMPLLDVIIHHVEPCGNIYKLRMSAFSAADCSMLLVLSRN